MLNTTLRRAIAHPTLPTSLLPPTFLLPLRARLSTTTSTTDPEPRSTAFQAANLKPPKPSSTPETASITPQPSSPPPPPPKTQLTQLTQQTPPTPHALLPLLAAQKPHYITAHLHSRPYLLTPGDTLRLPFLMPHAPAGTLLRLTRASSLGSRDYTYRGDPYVNERYFVCRARVVGVEAEPMRVIEKTKRRQRHVKRATSKGRFTVLRVTEVRVCADGDAGEDRGAVVEEDGL